MEANTRASRVSPADSLAGPDSPSRVLVADDQTDILLALRLLLRDAGFQVDAAVSVQEVRTKIDAGHYDLLLMDLNYARDTTSGVEGLELLAAVHARDPLLPVLVMTGWGSIETAVEAMRRGACGFVHKPWDNDALTAAIRREVDRGRALRTSERRAARDQQEAQAIQRALLPDDVPRVPGCDVAARWSPASTFGGDLYDLMLLDDGRVALWLGDVCGKGLPAALLMANVQASVRAFATADPSPSAVVTRINRELSRHASLRRFVTFFFGVYDPAARRLVYANAGHQPPIVVRANGAMPRLDVGGTVLGAFDTSQFEDGAMQLASGDRVVLVTDGITEAGAGDDRQQFGDERLLAILQREGSRGTARQLADAVFNEAIAFAGGAFADDATVLVAAIQ
jgi:sigma-B regulation protein RsbU (phosphoserine phosphatase)